MTKEIITDLDELDDLDIDLDENEDDENLNLDELDENDDDDEEEDLNIDDDEDEPPFDIDDDDEEDLNIDDDEDLDDLDIDLDENKSPKPDKKKSTKSEEKPDKKKSTKSEEKPDKKKSTKSEEKPDKKKSTKSEEKPDKKKPTMTLIEDFKLNLINSERYEFLIENMPQHIREKTQDLVKTQIKRLGDLCYFPLPLVERDGQYYLWDSFITFDVLKELNVKTIPVIIYDMNDLQLFKRYMSKLRNIT
jgi:hypothetical protein